MITVASFTKLTKGTLQLVVTTSGRRVTIDAIEVENTPTTGAIALAGGATFTNTRTVTVSSAVAATRGAVRMRLANGSSLGSTPYTAYASSKPFVLSSGDGAKRVAAQFADAAGNVSGVATDDIVLDTTPPAVTNTTPGTTEVPSGDIAINASLADASPIASVEVLTAPVGTSTFTTTAMTVDSDHFTVTLPAVQDSFDYTLRVVDAAGNVGVLPLNAPTGRFHVTVDPPPTSDQLIATALTNNTIDYPTSLEYRLWAQFGDPQLPAAVRRYRQRRRRRGPELAHRAHRSARPTVDRAAGASRSLSRATGRPRQRVRAAPAGTTAAPYG